MLQAVGLQAFVDGLSGVPLRERQAFSPTSNIAGLLSGYTDPGVKTVLPARAMAKMDFRLVPDQDPDDILRKLKAHLGSEGYDDVAVTKLGAAEPVVTPLDHPFVQRVVSSAGPFRFSARCGATSECPACRRRATPPTGVAVPTRRTSTSG